MMFFLSEQLLILPPTHLRDQRTCEHYHERVLMCMHVPVVMGVRACVCVFSMCMCCHVNVYGCNHELR